MSVKETEYESKILSKLGKYLHQGIYQEFHRMRLLKVCFYFCLSIIFLSACISVRYPNEQIHFLKEVCRWCMNIIFSLLSYLIGRKQEKDIIRNKLHPNNIGDETDSEKNS